jgi:hypothetical protein
MTGGGHPSAAGDGCARWWAELGPKASAGCGAKAKKSTGLPAQMGYRLDKWKGKEGKGKIGFFSLFYKNNQTHEFKHEFEFKHFKNSATSCMQ